MSRVRTLAAAFAVGLGALVLSVAPAQAQGVLDSDWGAGYYDNDYDDDWYFDYYDSSDYYGGFGTQEVGEEARDEGFLPEDEGLLQEDQGLGDEGLLQDDQGLGEEPGLF